MLKIQRALKNNRLMKSLTGMSVNEFLILLKSFEKVLYEHFANKPRKRKVGGGCKGILKDAQSKLFYILLYLKVYPTYDLAGFIFGADRSRCFHWTALLMPLLEKTLGRHMVLPKRQIGSLEEFLTFFPEVQDLFIDATERRTQRPQKEKIQRKRYSGKKKAHTRKNTIIANEQRKILFVSKTGGGRQHDLRQLKKTGVLEHIPKDVSLWLDKGYLGIQDSLKHNNSVMMPHKKPKGKSLTPEQKRENKIISGIRIVVEHAINGIKRFGSMSGIYRNRKGQDDHMIYLCSSLWNFHLQYATC
jgi:hypothetical protein